MSRAISKAIPFQMINGRQALSEIDIYNDPAVEAFVKRFRHLFYQDYLTCFLFYYPEGVPEHLTATVRPAEDFTKTIDH
jgi:hypothetical protein